MERIHEGGLLGSLRWWYEAIVRGLGGYACDPTADGSAERCQFDTKAYEDAKKQKDPHAVERGLATVCPACRLFGCTGWRRRFQLQVVDDQTQSAWTPQTQPLNVRPPDRNRGWFLPPGRMGTFTLRIDGDTETLARIAALLLFLERRGSLGAKPQLGYGVFAIEQRERVAGQAAGWQVMGEQAVNVNLPDLRHFGFFRYRFRPHKPGWWTQTPGLERVATQVRPLVGGLRTVPVAPALKNKWRFHHWQRGWGDERAFWGTLQPDRVRSHVAVSWAYLQGDEWEVRGYAWLHQTPWNRTKQQPQLERPLDRQAVWAMFCETKLWQTALGEAGSLDVHPALSWQEWSTVGVQQFLEATR